MRKLIIILSILIGVSSILYGIYHFFLIRTPEKILKNSFDICLKEFDYKADVFEEDWASNGDGYAFIVFNFDSLSVANIEYLEALHPELLPISKLNRSQMLPNEIPEKYFNSTTGYYLYKPTNNKDYRNFKVFIIDTYRKLGILYYQIM